MPLHEYECEVCGVRFERRQAVADDPLMICPECGGQMCRLIQPTGIIFKGRGFYVTDNKKVRSSIVAPKGKDRLREGHKQSTRERGRDT